MENIIPEMMSKAKTGKIVQELSDLANDSVLKVAQVYAEYPNKLY